MNKLFLVWNSYKKNSYIPIGILEKKDDLYTFMYLYESAKEAFEDGCILPFPLSSKPFVSNNLFPFFKDRIMTINRENLEEYLTSINMDKYDEFLLLSMTKGVKVNDNFKVYTSEEYKLLNSDRTI